MEEKSHPLTIQDLEFSVRPEIHSKEESQMGTKFIKKEDPVEREYRFILEKEVEQWYKIEEVVNKYAYVDESKDMIIFFTEPMHC